MLRRCTLRVLVGMALASSPAFAGDGRFEINQSCAAGGCFANDGPGFPVQFTSAGSYLLTSNLTGSTANTTAITLAVGATVIQGNAQVGIRAPIAVVKDNGVKQNGSFGFLGTSAALSGNNFYNNNSFGDQISGGVEIGENVCDGSTTCP